MDKWGNALAEHWYQYHAMQLVLFWRENNRRAN
jgi:hypothetical protein